MLYDYVLTHITNGLDIPILAIYDDVCILGKLDCKEEKRVISILKNLKKSFYVGFEKIGDVILIKRDRKSYLRDSNKEREVKKEIDFNWGYIWIEIETAIKRPYFSVQYVDKFWGYPGHPLVRFDSNREIFTEGDFLYGEDWFNQDSKLTELVRKTFCPACKILDVTPTYLQILIPLSCRDLWHNVVAFVVQNLTLEILQK